MGKPTGFIEIHRKKHPTRPVAERIHDWREVYLPYPQPVLEGQAARCMDCGIPFCHQGCPLGNLIPDWNDLVYRDRWRQAIDRLHATNNFPEFTGPAVPGAVRRLVRARHQRRPGHDQVDRGLDHRARVRRRLGDRAAAGMRTGKRVAVVGSGPAGLAAADQLNRAGHWVTVFERADRIGGLLRYGIPEFKMEKRFLDRRLAVMQEEGVIFRTSCHVGVNVPVDELRARLRRGRARRRRDRAARSEGARAASSPASTSRWSICRCRTAATKATRFPTIGSSPPRTST